MNRLLLLILLLSLTGSFRVLAQRSADRHNPAAVLQNRIIIPGPAQTVVSRSRTLRQAPDATCDTILLTRQSQIDSFNILYPGCNTVEILEINGAGASPAITRLDSLYGITDVVRKLKVSHTSVTSLEGLSALVNPGDTLELAYNFLQTSIGLSNLTGLNHLFIRKLPALNSITGLATGITGIGSVFIDSTALTSLDGLEDVTTIAGNLEIWHTPLTDLGSLTSLVSIGGALKLDQMYSMNALGLSNLTQLGALLLSGLPNLTQLGPVSYNLTNRNLGTFWTIQTGLTSLAGLDSIQSLSNFYIWLNPDLTSLQGLQQVSGNVPSGISLWGNDALTDITALSQITSISSGELDLHGNNQLADLTGLGNILTIGKRFRIYENPVVTSLSFLNNALEIQDQDNQGIQIENNPQLAICSFTPVCNYLSNGGFGTIQNNATGCNSLTELQAGCSGGCVSGVLRTWTGTQGTDWNDPANWSPAGVPGYCDRVYIPSGIVDNPGVSGNISIGGLIIESGSWLDMNGFNLTVRDTLNISDGDINGAQTILFRNIHNPYILDASLQAGNGITLDKYYGSLDILFSQFDGAVLLIDSIGRDGIASLQGNQFYHDLTFIGTTQVSGAHTILSGAADDYISGNLTVAYTSVASFFVGTGGGTPYIGGDLNLNTDVDPARIVLNSVAFNGGTDSHIRQFGTTPVAFNNLYTEKFSRQQLIIPEQPVYLRNSACLSGGLIKTTPSTLLIAEDNASINCHSSESWVWGPLKKIGDDQFTFVVGDSLKKALLTMATAPAQVTDAFTARYFRVNPATAGYDTSLHASSLTAVSGREYWMFTRDNGNSRVRINLQYDSTRSQPISSIYSLRASQWNGAQWINNGALSVTGNLHEAYVTSQDSLQVFGPVTLGYVIPPRIPVITLTQMDTVACRGATLKVRFTVDTLMFPTNTFSAQLSDSAGGFASPLLIGQVGSASTADSINAFIPFNVPLSAAYRVRVTGTAPPATSVNTRPLSVKTIPQVSFTITGPAVGCINSGVQKYYPSQPEAGVNYNWTVSGGTFTTNQDTAFVTWTTPGTRTISLSTSTICGNGPSSSRNITVSFPAPTAAPVITRAGRWLYASAPDTAQRSLGYRWFRNDTLISGAVNSSYYASLAGSYTVRYYNLCGNGPASNTVAFPANSLPQTISFPAIPNKTYGDAPFSITATASSGYPVTLSLVSGPGSLTGNTYTITTTGTSILRASQAGDDVYDTAAVVISTVTINKAAQSINFPPLTDQNISASPLTLSATASSGLPVTYTLQSGPASLTGNLLSFTGLGTVSVTANQPGDTNFLAAPSVNRSFCVRVNELGSISGAPFVCPGQTATYRINKVTGLTYSWRLTDGTSFSSTADTVVITWSGSGSKTLVVSATGPCGAPTANDSLVVNIITAVSPGAVSNMLPVNGAQDQQLPLNLSWQPGLNALTYDLYVWDSAAAQPANPFAANLTNNAFLLNEGTLLYNKAYQWRVVSKNACLETSGPIQHFRLKKLPDLVVTQVQAPASAFSGQTISINWTVRNAGPGTTGSSAWNDAVFLSFDTLPNFSSPQVNPNQWNSFEFPVRPLLVGTRSNLSALDSGQQYQNSINFTLPANYSLPLYAYVITNYPAGNGFRQMTVINDTNRAIQPIAVTLSPTPDLRVDTVFTPSAVFSGSTINVTYKVKNYGVNTPTGSVWTDKFYISQSPLFNINTALPLKAPRLNGTYYPDAQDASVTINTPLLADSSYTRSADVVIPNFISGPWYVFVQTNAHATMFEGALINNNFNSRLLQVFLTPTPKLTVNSLLVPVTTASVTQPVGINWNVLNTGFSDNREKNKGHYYRPSGSCQTNRLQLTDSVGFGSSYWIDRVYLSTDSTGINGNALLIADIAQGIENSGIGADAAPPVKCVAPGTDPAGENINTFNVIRPGSGHPGQLNFTIPSNLEPGNYYVYVKTNATQTVFEYPGTPQIRRSALPIAVQRPDLTVSASVPVTSTAGQPVTISYTVTNNGPGAVFNALRRDWIYISSSPVFNGSAQLIDSLSVTESLPVGTPVVRTRTYTLPNGTSGARYFFVRTNADSSFRETNNGNNISPAAMTNVINPTPADLVVTAVPLADSLFTIFNATMRYTVANNGPGSTYGSWTDSIFISCSPVYSPATSYFVARRIQNRILPAGASYSDSTTVQMNWSWQFNACFPETETATAYFFVKTNASGDVYEAANNSNNITGSGARILINPLVDHIVTAASGPDTVTVARPFSMSWTVKNIGYNPGGNNYSLWTDAVFFSIDSVENGNDVPGSSFLMSRTLQRNQHFTETKTAVAPNLPTGDYYVLAKSNAFNSPAIMEKVRSNNSNFFRNTAGAAKKVHVIQPLLPDLTDTILVAPASIPAGQPVTIVHRITNTGAGPVYPAAWSTKLWLSQDFIPGNAGDRPLAGVNKNIALQPGQSLTDTITFTPDLNTLTGNYILIAQSDAENNVVESSETNNLGFRNITVFLTQPVDLLVENISVPDTVLLGNTLDSVRWVVANLSPHTASGVSSDGIYLSKNPVLDSTATLVGIKAKTLNMPPLGRDTVSAQPRVTTLTEGAYRVIIRTDLLNNINETNKNNNTGTATGSVYVKVRELKLNQPETNTLQSISRFYKLVIPDSLRGATILVSLRSNDSLTMRNELYIGLGYVPSPARFDERFNTANYGNQQIVMSSVTDSVYYIMARCVSPNPVVQQITLEAVRLPFAILNVQSASGGNIGNVTVKLSGSLFTQGMSARLSRPGTTIGSSAIYFVNSTTVFATFNLQGRPVGLYDVSLIKSDSSVATLAGSFTIANANNGGVLTGGGNNTGQSGSGNAPGCDPGTPGGLNSLLATDLVVPERVFADWPFVIQINYVNPANFDIPVQSRNLYNDQQCPMALTQAGLPAGTDILSLELTEPGGPPGIIRAGGSGSITIYVKARANIIGHTFIKFTVQ